MSAKSKYQLSNSKVIIPRIPVGIVGVGSYLPPKIIKNSDFTNLKLSNEEKLFFDQNSGIEERRFAENESYTDIAVKAAKNALENSKIDAKEIDMVVVTHISKDINRLTPPNSTYIQTEIGATNATSINIDMGFTGWIYALITGASFIASGFYKTVLVVSGETILTNTDNTIMKSMLIGDGGGAFILRQVPQNYGLLAYHLMSEEYKEIAAGVKIMQGYASPFDKHLSTKAFFTIAPNSFERDLPYVENFIPFSVSQILQNLNLKADNINKYFFAQKFIQLNKKWAENIGIEYSKVHDTLHHTACVETSSIPIITNDAVEKNILRKGDLIMFADLGSNWSVGSALFRWCI